MNVHCLYCLADDNLNTRHHQNYPVYLSQWLLPPLGVLDKALSLLPRDEVNSGRSCGRFSWFLGIFSNTRPKSAPG
ncbi:hypothetical protein TIFTF001_037942 [Ficus carica]|uniref:Uncharacterized protein n=1 Tax=Ficus carica TaxID=3494 RepID=A0AA88E6W5_FICCA|nr:hypothetical protein TIFTF001_037942 [Ficus carica]